MIYQSTKKKRGSVLHLKGRFEILSLSGSFLVQEIGGHRTRTGGLIVSLAGPDGRVLGGGVAGVLIACTPTQIVVGSFITDTGEKAKKQQAPSEPVSAPPKLALIAPLIQSARKYCPPQLKMCLFGILMLHLSSLGSFTWYSLIRTEMLLDDTGWKYLVGGKQICAEGKNYDKREWRDIVKCNSPG